MHFGFFYNKTNSGLLLTCDRLVSQYNVNVKRFILERKRNPNYFIVNKQIHPVLLHWNVREIKDQTLLTLT